MGVCLFWTDWIFIGWDYGPVGTSCYCKGEGDGGRRTGRRRCAWMKGRDLVLDCGLVVRGAGRKRVPELRYC